MLFTFYLGKKTAYFDQLKSAAELCSFNIFENEMVNGSVLLSLDDFD